MVAAPTHTIHVSLFELHGIDDRNGGNSDGGAKALPGRNATTERCVSACRMESCRKTRGLGVACDERMDRFGPGKLSRRYHQIERLRELRALQSSDVVRDAPTGARLSRGSTSGSRRSTKELGGDNADTGSRNNKRRRESSGEGHRAARQIPPPPERCSPAAEPVFKPWETAPYRDAKKESQSHIGPDIPQERRHAEQARGKLSARDDAGPVGDLTKRDLSEVVVGCRSLLDTAPDQRYSLRRPDEGPVVASDLMAGSKHGIGAFAAAGVSPQILPIRCAPASRRPRADAGSTSVSPRGGGGGGGGSGGSKVQKLRSREGQQNEERQRSRECESSDQSLKAVTGRAGDTIAGCPAVPGVGSNDNGVPTGSLAAGEKKGTSEPPAGYSAVSKLEYPRIADTCGGIVLRLTPAERSLEPWGGTLAPLRAMCDIEPSLSRAGIEYRGVVHAVEGAQQLKLHHKAKQRKAHNAKSLLGHDIRPRTSEPRLRVIGVTTELDVLKSILVRERLIVTLRRLIRKIQRHCVKLQELLRREAKYRRQHSKRPPGALSRATQSARKTLHAGQQELRVVLAHLRAISIDTVTAICEWRSSFVSSEKPRYRAISRTGSAPSLSYVENVPRSGLPAAVEQERSVGDSALAGPSEEEEDGHGADSIREDNQARCAKQYFEGNVEVNRHLKNHDGNSHGNNGDHHATNDGGEDTEEISEPETKAVTPYGNHLHSSGGGGDGGGRDSLPPIFRWKGVNYLTKMVHDLDFLDDGDVSAPVTTWLDFSVRGNPFLVPPAGQDVCEALRRQQEDRREETAVRRRQRQQRTANQHRVTGSSGGGGGGGGQRRLSRSHSRSRTKSDGEGDGRRLSGPGSASVGPSPSCGRTRHEGPHGDGDASEGQDSLPTTAVSDQHLQRQEQERRRRQQQHAAETAANDTRRPEGLDPTTEAMSAVTSGLPVGSGGQEVAAAADSSIGSASTSIRPPLLAGLEDREAEEAWELSSGEEGEVKWEGGGSLDAPIIPDLPRLVRSKASAAEAVLRGETAFERAVESSAREIAANARRTRDILKLTGKPLPSRRGEDGGKRSASSNAMESLAERSCREGLRGVLVGRHIGAGTLKPAAAAVAASSSSSFLSSSCSAVTPPGAPCWEKGPLFPRRVSTAPARGESVGARRPSAAVAGSPAVGVIANNGARMSERKGKHRNRNAASFGSSRQGIRVPADGPGEEMTDWTVVMPDGRRDGSGKCDGGSSDVGGGGNAASPVSHRRGRSNQRTLPVPVEATTNSLSFTCITGPSAGGSSSLQASSSSMSSRARARAAADRPTVTRRRPFFRTGGGTVVIADPGQSTEIRHQAASLIQAGFFAACARRFVRQLREDRQRGAVVIGRSWRRSRARAGLRAVQHTRRAGELRSTARDRAARVVQTFFRDVNKYRRHEDQDASSQRDPERVASEVREQKAATTVQAATRLFMAYGRVRKLRHARRTRAQVRIALAVRQRAAYLASTQRRRAEGQEGDERAGGPLLIEGRREETLSSSSSSARRGGTAGKRRPQLQFDQAATLIQAWLRGRHCRRNAASSAANLARTPQENPSPPPPATLTTKAICAGGSKSAHLRAALEALRAAHSAAAAAGKERRPVDKSGVKALGQQVKEVGGDDVQETTVRGAAGRKNLRSGRSGIPASTGAAASPTALRRHQANTPPSSPSSGIASPRLGGGDLRRQREVSARRVSDRRNTPSRRKKGA